MCVMFVAEKTPFGSEGNVNICCHHVIMKKI
jgi:hypothetical protein